MKTVEQQAEEFLKGQEDMPYNEHGVFLYTLKHCSVNLKILLADFAEQILEASQFKQEWVRVSDRLPEEHGEYIVYDHDRDIQSVSYWDGKIWGYLASVEETPTHWTDLLETPITP